MLTLNDFLSKACRSDLTPESNLEFVILYPLQWIGVMVRGDLAWDLNLVSNAESEDGGTLFCGA